MHEKIIINDRNGTSKIFYVEIYLCYFAHFSNLYLCNDLWTMESRSKVGKIVANIHEQNINVPLSASQLGQISIDVRVNAISFSAGGYNQRGIGVN